MTVDLVVVSSDPGVTNSLVPVVGELIDRKIGLLIIASGPAIKIWRRSDFYFKIKIIDDAITNYEATQIVNEYQPSMIITGAGAYNLIEHTFRQVACTLGIFSFSLLDFWDGYLLRFRREVNGKISYIFPDLIGVMDILSYNEMIAEGFDSEKLIVLGAPHLENSVNFLTSLSKPDIDQIRQKIGTKKDIRTFVFFSQTMSVVGSNDIGKENKDCDKSPWGYTQFSILETIIKMLSAACDRLQERGQLIVKPHPMEKSASILEVIKTTEISSLLNCRMVDDCDALSLIGLADAVLSMSSTTLIEAGLAGKRAYSIQIVMGSEKGSEYLFDNFCGNRMGLSTPIFRDIDLENAFETILTAPKSQINKPVDQRFKNSTIKVADVIWTNIDIRKYKCNSF